MDSGSGGQKMIEALNKGAADNPGRKTLRKGSQKWRQSDFSHVDPVIPDRLKQFGSAMVDRDLRIYPPLLKNAFFYAIEQRKSFNPE